MSGLTRDRLEDLMESNPNIKSSGWTNPDKHGFCRTYEFEVRGATYEIEWYCNYSELRCGEMIVLFDNFKIDNTWPHHYKNNLQFYRNGKVCCVIPIEEYKEQEGDD